MPSRQEAVELCQKMLAKERQACFRKRQKINKERIVDERQKRLVKERQDRLIKRQHIKDNNYLPERQEAADEIPKLRQMRLAKERQACFRKRQKINNERMMDELECITRHDLGQMDQICIHCGAKFWMEEKDHSSNRTFPTFSICCAHGKVLLQIGRAHV